MRIVFVKRSAVDVSRVPSSAECSTRAASSDAERAEEISSCGSIPMRASTQFAVPPSTQMMGRATTVKAIWKGTTRAAVLIGWANARFLGTSSPKSMEKTLTKAAATKAATPVASPHARPALPSRPASRSARALCVVYPSRIVVSVMPTWAPESWVDKERVARKTEAAPRSPSSARLSSTA